MAASWLLKPNSAMAPTHTGSQGTHLRWQKSRQTQFPHAEISRLQPIHWTISSAVIQEFMLWPAALATQPMPHHPMQLLIPPTPFQRVKKRLTAAVVGADVVVWRLVRKGGYRTQTTEYYSSNSGPFHHCHVRSCLPFSHRSAQGFKELTVITGLNWVRGLTPAAQSGSSQLCFDEAF